MIKLFLPLSKFDSGSKFEAKHVGVDTRVDVGLDVDDVASVVVRMSIVFERFLRREV